MEQEAGSATESTAHAVTPETKVGEIMTRNVLTARPGQSVLEVVQLLAKNRITGLPVVDADNRLIGVVSESDIIGKAGETGADIMTHRSWPVTEEPPLGAAAEILLRRRSRRLPVVRCETELVGLAAQ